ncbi:RING/FYVE/PHD zinc finger superfamily protein [Perilla frutescens var. hirtella]|uniref:RING/FYVE/PHD zinc finger superfamily protein n=1 Tax=Perilla frutescens var. hirtella TaxID=608512 RepID=A0AAD4NXC8_PERFH|nr:RING/FYVE/PHD zinc finger superfamily protein [Perilla frutescens var. hirtella]
MASPFDYSYPSFPPNPDHVHNPPQYSFPHVQDTAQNHHLYHQNQTPLDYDYDPRNSNPNPEPAYDPSYSLNSYAYGSSDVPYHANSYESSLNYGGDQRISDDGVYKYNGEPVEFSYGGKGGRSSDSRNDNGVMFDDYGRPIVPGRKEQNEFGNSSPKIVKAVPKVEDSEDVKSGVQKFRVKLLSEGYGQPDMDVLCQVGLDGIRFLDPATSRMLKVYPLDTVTRCEVLDSYIFAFWAKTSVDPEPRRVRLKSNSYTTNNILDAVTAASIQSKEIGSSSTVSNVVKGTDQSLEKKKGFIDWKNLIKPMNEEKDHWVPDEAVTKCTACASDFSAFNRKHHCRNCGDIYCDKCTQGRITLTADENAQPVRVCDRCMAEVTQRLSNNIAPGRAAGLQSHEDLARKLQEEMEKNRKTGVKSEVSSRRMREVACPTCTIHLQVQVPTSGSETIECSVCQHPFLVSAH